jgi:hypothetical protein
MKTPSFCLFALMGLMLAFAGGCRKSDKDTLPVLTTAHISQVNETTAVSGGTIISDGGAGITSRGVCWSTGKMPTIKDHKTMDGSGTGSFTSLLTGLDSNILYYVRAYATNSVGTGYGDTVSFRRALPDSIEFTDINPDVIITSVRYWNPPTLQYNCYQPIPYDSSASYKLDTDKDGVADFNINISNWFEFHSASNPCYNFMYYSDISTLVPGDSIAITGQPGACALIMEAGDTISASLSYYDRAETVRDYWMAMPCVGGIFSGEKYFGFKMPKGNGFIYGWLLMHLDRADHKLTIKEFAINKTIGKKILAGQKE